MMMQLCETPLQKFCRENPEFPLKHANVHHYCIMERPPPSAAPPKFPLYGCILKATKHTTRRVRNILNDNPGAFKVLEPHHYHQYGASIDLIKVQGSGGWEGWISTAEVDLIPDH